MVERGKLFDLHKYVLISCLIAAKTPFVIYTGWSCICWKL